MNGSDAVAARFLRSVVDCVKWVLPGHVSREWMKTNCVEFTVDGLRFDVFISPELDLKAYLKEGCQPGKAEYNGRYRCRLELPFPMASNWFEPSVQRERRVSENGLQKVAAQFAGLIVAAVEASKRERGPRLVVDNTVGCEA